MNIPAIQSSWARLIALCLAIPAYLCAYPPAPAAQYFGEVRDGFGNQVSSKDAWVLFKFEDRVIARVELRSGFRPRENYRALLPIDTSTDNPYNAAAVPTGVTLTLEVEVAGIHYPAYGITPESALKPQASVAQRLDFTIGEDTDGDRIPDLWELWQLERDGIFEGDERYSLESIGQGDHDNDGLSDYQEYVAGVFAFLFVETLDMKAKGISADGWLSFELVQAEGQAYQMEVTSDLANWSTVRVSLDGQLEQLTQNWTAEDTSIRDIEVQVNRAGPLFFRVRRIDGK